MNHLPISIDDDAEMPVVAAYIVKNISSGSRVADVALTCAIDLYRAAAYVDTNLGDVILLEIAVGYGP